MCTILWITWVVHKIVCTGLGVGHAQGRTVRVDGAACEEWVTGYFQRVVIAKPARMKANPAPRFQRPQDSTGYCSWVM